MNKRILLTIIIFLVINWLFAPTPFAGARVYKVYIVAWRGLTEAERGFMDYFSARKIPVEFIVRDCATDKNKLPEFVREIKDKKPDLVYVFGTTGALGLFGSRDNHAADKYITSIPGIFNIVSVPVEAKLVANLKSSGRNITGVYHIAAMENQISALMSVIKPAKIGTPYNPQEMNSVLALRKLEMIGKQYKFKVASFPFRLKEDKNPDPGSITEVIQKLLAEKPDIVYMPSDSFMVSHAKQIVDMLNERKIPVFSATEDPIVKGGAFMGLVCHYYNLGQYSGYKAEQILVREKKPADIPIDSLNRFSFIFNITTARRIDFYPPFNILKFVEFVK